MKKTVKITPPEELARQKEYIGKAAEILSATYAERPRAHVRTFGCQQNVSDSERIKGMLAEMGYELWDSEEGADLVLYNTCAVRGHAEDRVFGNVGALKHLKRRRPGMIIALCGCMMQQEHVAERIRKTYPHVDLLFGTHRLPKLPELLCRVLSRKERVFDISGEESVTEGLPVRRDGIRGWLPVMYGCDNFCTYCVVPLVRGRERSRAPEDVLAEARAMIDEGFKDITLLGQNVNSYRPAEREGYDFAKLLRDVCALPGDFRIRFMTSHPKDCTEDLLLAMRDCDKAAKHLHLPFQSGSDRILKAMNRGYTAEKYLNLVRRAKELMPDLTLTADVIVGFPGEDEEDFRKTLDLVREAEFASLFTFIYSPREGTAAAKLPDPVPREEKVRRMDRLLALQESVTRRLTESYVGRVLRVLCEGPGRNPGYAVGRTSGNLLAEFPAETPPVGEFLTVRVTEADARALIGEPAPGAEPDQY